MFILRATKKLRQRIGSPTLREGERSTTLLGDWYATSFAWRPQVALLEHMRDWRIAATASRSVVGIMNEFTFLADTCRAAGRVELLDLAVQLAATPCSPLYQRHISPGRELAALLRSTSSIHLDAGSHVQSRRSVPSH